MGASGWRSQTLHQSSKTSLPEPSTNKAESEGSRLLPSLKDTVGSAYSAQRPLQPQPDPSHPVPELFIPGVSVLYLDDLPIRTYTVGGFRYNMAQPKKMRPRASSLARP